MRNSRPRASVIRYFEVTFGSRGFANVRVNQLGDYVLLSSLTRGDRLVQSSIQLASLILANGSATPISGKSLTCRKRSSEFEVYDRWVEDP